MEQSDDSSRVFRSGGEGRHDRDGVVIGLDDDGLVPPSLRLFPALGRQHLWRSGQVTIHVVRFHALPIHPRIQMDGDRPVLQAHQQIESVLPLEPKSRDVNRHLEELVRGLLAVDAAIVKKNDGLGPQRCGVEVVLAAGKVQEYDAALHGLAVQCFERALTSVDQGPAHAVRPQRGRAHAIGPQAVEPLAVAALHHQLAAAIYRHGHLKCLALHVLQSQRLKPLAHVLAGLSLPCITRHPRAEGGKVRYLSGNVRLVNAGD